MSRCLDDVIQITSNINTALKIHETDSVRNVDLSKEVIAWRSHLRESEYLKLYQDEQKVYSITGEELSSSLIELPTQLKHCMNCYWQKIESGEEPNMKKIFVMKNVEDLLYYDIYDEI